MRNRKQISASLTSCFFLLGVCAASGQAIRTWDNGAGTGKWSDAANWSGDALPEPGDAVVFDGAVSQAACAADIVTNQLGSITLGNGYTNRVAFAVNAVQGGMSLTVTGAIALASGEMTFKGDVNAIGGGTTTVKHGAGYDIAAQSVFIAAGAALHADALGFAANQGPGKPANGERGASHGGEGGYGSHSLATLGAPVTYGSLYGPAALGSGAVGFGGGAIKLTVAGSCIVNGRLSADAEPRNVSNGRGAAGGSLWIRGGALSGTGVISASGASGYNSTIAGGGGGRIDLSETVNNFAGQVNVLGGCWNNDNTYRGLAGTVVFPQTAGTGLTMQNFVPYTNIAIGGGVALSSVLVNPGITLWLESNGADHVYTMDSLVVTGTATSVGQVICRGNISQANAASGGTAAVPHGRGVVIECRSLVIHPNGRLHANAQGFGAKFGPGRSPATGYGSTHGGLGGSYSPYTYELPAHYGTPLAPTSLGSGGNGGAPGGGAIALDVSETLVVNGQLTADAPKSTGSNSGGGAGGSIWIRAPRLQGGGLISASGGDGVSTGHGGGGGGRIDLSATINDFSGDIRIWGGHPTFRNPLRGKTGTMRLPQSAGSGLTINAFVVTNVVRLGEDLNLSRVEVRPGGTLFLDAQTNRWAYSFDSLTLTGTVTSAASVVCLSDFHAVNPVSGGLVTNRHGRGVTIQADAVTVGSWCSIEAIGSGFVGGNGPGTGAGQSNAGSYGGRGSRLTGTGVCYGVMSAPTALGSGGGNSGSAAGGAIRFIVGALTNNGLISASAGVSTRNHAGASGGSLWLECGSLAGGGALEALGCSAINNHAGGGGRIAVLIDAPGQTGLSMSANASGGLRNNDVKLDGAAGTVYFRNIADPASPGLLRFDNPGRTTVDPVWTELPPRLAAVDAAVAESVLLLTNSAHVGLTSDCLVKDLFLRTGSLLRLNGYTLRVDSYRHPDWGSDAWVDYGGGEILWRGGTVIIVH